MSCRQAGTSPHFFFHFSKQSELCALLLLLLLKDLFRVLISRLDESIVFHSDGLFSPQSIQYLVVVVVVVIISFSSSSNCGWCVETDWLRRKCETVKSVKGERSNAFLCLVFSSLVLVLALNNKEEVGREGNYSMLTDPILFIACSIRPTKNLTGILHKQRTYTRVYKVQVCAWVFLSPRPRRNKKEGIGETFFATWFLLRSRFWLASLRRRVISVSAKRLGSVSQWW